MAQPKEEFQIKLTFADGYAMSDPMTFHISNGNTVQNIGEFPLISLTFTN